MPIYNGEVYLAKALDSIISQTFEDFELVICDNASTDSTGELCQDYAANDQRIQYHRQIENIGAARNYNDTFFRARGRYFKWAAHDDMIAPSFLESCCAVLEADSSIAIAFSQMREIDSEDNIIRDYDAQIIWQGQTPASRLESLLCAPPSSSYIHRCVPITGLMRAEMLRQTRLIGRFAHADKVALVEMALLGNFVEIPERLFYRRIHPGVSLAANKTPILLNRWFDPKNRARFIAPRSRLFREYIHAVARAPIHIGEKKTCLRSLVWMFRKEWRILGGEIKQALWNMKASQP